MQPLEGDLLFPLQSAILVAMTLRRMIDWLERHRGFNLLFIGVYFAIVIAMHDILANLSVSIVAEISLPTYDVVIACIGLGLALLALWILIRNGPPSPPPASLPRSSSVPEP